MSKFTSMFKVSPRRKKKSGNVKMKLKMFAKKNRSIEKYVQFKGKKIQLYLVSHVNGNVYNINEAMRDLKTIEKKYNTYLKLLVSGQYKPYAKSWMEGREQYTPQQWLDKIELGGINFYSGGEAEIWWWDDSIFMGHMLGIELSPKTFTPVGGVSMNG